MAQGCFRGIYAEESASPIALLTCGADGKIAPFAALPPASFLCVLELLPEVSPDDVTSFIAAQSALHPELLSAPSVLFSANGTLVLSNPSDLPQVTPFCSLRAFPDGMLRRASYVPTAPVVPQAPMPVGHPAVRRSVLGLEPLARNPIIEDYLGAFKQHKVQEYVEWLSTDRKGTSLNITRNSYAIRTGAGGCFDAETWRCAHLVVEQVVSAVEDLLEHYPHPWSIERAPFRADMCSNIRLVIPGATKPSSVVVIGAHIDSRNTASGAAATGPAPGADDNASGSAVNLEIVRAIATNAKKHRFEHTVHILWFCGEEQGLLGSAAMAKEYKQQGVDIIGMFNNDMIAYTDPKIGMVLSFMKGSATKWLTDSCKAFSALYVPNLPTGDTGACCSDQQSFFAQGFPAAGIFETPTSGVVYPNYHKSTDTWNSGLINYNQIWSFGLANFCCILEYAIPIDD